MFKKILLLAVIASFAVSPFSGSQSALAYKPAAMVTFTFDEGDKATYDLAATTLANYGMPGVYYGETGPLNEAEDWIMSWDQVRSLRDKYGWEIGSHTISHPYLTQISDEELVKELKGSKDAFAVQGIDVKTFSTPYGDYNLKVLSTIARYYESHRAAWGGPNVWPNTYNDYEIVTKEVTNLTTPAQVNQWFNQAVKNKQWLVLLFHKIVAGKPNPYEYNYTKFQTIVKNTAAKALKVVTISQGLVFSSQENLVKNYGFSELDAAGWASNWSRTNETNVVIDKENKGNVFGPENSLKITGGAEQNEALTDLIGIAPSQEYILRMYQNVQDYVSGGWAVYISEFKADGTWLSGKWMGGTYANFVGYKYYQYKPKSAKVAKVQIHVFTEPGSQLTLFVDSVELKAPNSVLPVLPTVSSQLNIGTTANVTAND